MKNYVNISCLCALASFPLPVLADDEIEEGFYYDLGAKLRLRSDVFEDIYANDGERESENYVRRADFEVSGGYGQLANYELEIKVDREGKAELKTAEVDINFPLDFSVALGRFDPDYGLELSGSSTWVTGVERSAIWDLAPYAGEGSGAQGIAIRHHQKHHFASIGYFDTDAGKVSDARFVYAPIQKKKKVVHLGYSYAEAIDALADGEIKTDLSVYGAKFSDNGNSTKLARDISAGFFNKDSVQTFELAYMQGPFSVQGEYLQRELAADDTSENRSANGSYWQVAYTLTGEARDYSMSKAKFGRIKPTGKYGAWEIFLRKDQLHTSGEFGLLSKKRSEGRAAIDVLGINWYSAENWKISANYLRAETGSAIGGIANDVGDIDGKAYSLQVQFKF